MRRRRRGRFLIAGLILSALTGTAFVLSGCWYFTIRVPNLGGVGAGNGAVDIGMGPTVSTRVIRAREFGFKRWNEWSHQEFMLPKSKIVHLIVIPLWPLFIAVAIPTLLVWRFVPKFPRGHCRRCGYNLKGLTEARCPECGTEFA